MSESPVVLIVEQDVALVLELTECIEAAGCAAVLAHSSAQALEVAGTRSPDLVLLDLDLPGEPMDELIRKLPVPPARIVLTSHDPASEARGGVEATGVALLLQRPIDCEELRKFITAFLGRPAP
jgi:DNA-binding response OmpR family regulator